MKKMFYLVRISIWLFLTGSCWKSHAQAEKLRFEHITVDKGIANNTVIDLFQDSKGYLWICTWNGLNKYDGYNFTTYQFDPDDTSSIGGNAITVICEDKDGTIWVVVNGVGIYLFDRTTEKFTRFKPKAGPAPSYLSTSWALNVDSEGKIWMTTDNGSLLRYDKQAGKFFDEDYALQIFSKQDSGNHLQPGINTIYKDKSGTLWVASTQGLHRLNLTPQEQGKPSKVSFTSYWHHADDTTSIGSNPWVIYQDRQGMLWVGSEGPFSYNDSAPDKGGLYRLNPKTGKGKRYRHQATNPASLSNNIITGIVEDNEGNLWISTNNGLNKLNNERTAFTHFFHDDNDPASLTENRIFSLFVDKQNILWLSFLHNGINKADLNQNPIALYQHIPSDARSLSSNAVAAICEDKAGTVWIGTIGGGLNAWDKRTNIFRHYRHNPSESNSLGSDSVSALLEDHAGNLWVGGGKNSIGIVSKLDRKSGQFKHYFFKYPYSNTYGNPILTLYEDSQGGLWIGTTNGMIRFDPKTEKWIYYPYDPNNPERLSDYWVNAICEDKRGNLWIGHNSNKLVKFNLKTGRFTQYTHNPNNPASITSSVVKSIFKDSKGTLWFATKYGGLCRLDEEGETFTAFTKRDGLPSNTVYSVLEDDNGHLWLTTDKGLSRFNPSTRRFLNFDVDDGLQSNQFEVRVEHAGACFKGADGTLYFGGPNGFNAFHPQTLKFDDVAPPVALTRFFLFDKLIPGKNEAKAIVLNHDENFFSFEFAALNFSNTAKNQYAYQLVGVDEDWVYSGSRRLASYTDVGHGDYVFRVKAANKDGVWNEQGTSMKISIRPPWWRTSWAFAFYALCFVAGVFAVHRFQRQRVIRRERERAKEKELEQAKEIEKAYTELKATQAQLIQSEKMASLGELTAGIAHEIQNPLNFVNNFSEVNVELINELQAELKGGNTEDAFLISKELKNNEEKISEHGKRADGIVKSMLQHTRKNTGERQLTDINALADEYLRLAYHGLRAKDKSFNATFTTNFDESIGKINVVPQDIGRVFLNLFNNAFYTVHEKMKKLSGDYEPSVSVSTKEVDGKIEIRVQDNGMGISKGLQDKIFQPFFTTKPTGEGTGLGLSLSYDIIKAHGGELKVESEEGQYTVFIVQLPLV
jgi:ligand-binding sensor domain-containing protein/signal transduction histidine kinase